MKRQELQTMRKRLQDAPYLDLAGHDALRLLDYIDWLETKVAGKPTADYVSEWNAKQDTAFYSSEHGE